MDAEMDNPFQYASVPFSLQPVFPSFVRKVLGFGLTEKQDLTSICPAFFTRYSSPSPSRRGEEGSTNRYLYVVNRLV